MADDKQEARSKWDKASMALSYWAIANGHHNTSRSDLDAIAPAELLQADVKALKALQAADPDWK